MSELAVHAPAEIPTFSECVVGYRAWLIDDEDRLWPASDHRAPWIPGINTARCNCAVHGALSFNWSLRDGRRVLEPHPAHDAPEVNCTCGLYSWRRPRRRWETAPRLKAGRTVCGAVASWGRVMVHDDGFRAEHACVVTLAYPPDIESAALDKLRRVASRYRVELVPLDRLEQAASRHGSPVPDTIRPEHDADPHDTSRVVPGATPPGPEDTGAERVRRGRTPPRQRTPPPGLEPIPTRDKLGLALCLGFALVAAASSAMAFGRGTTAYVGFAVWGGCFVGEFLTLWWLEPHKAASRVHTHAKHRLRHRMARDDGRPHAAHMTDAEVNAIEDALEPLYKHGNDMSNSLDPYRLR